MASHFDLPQELVDKIVSELRNDIPALCTCALISRDFLPWSRLHLFSSVRLTGGNFYAFRTLIASSPAVASYVRRLEMPLMASLPAFVLLPPESMARLPNLTKLSTHCDPFGFRHLSAAQHRILSDTTRHLTSVELSIDRFWTLPEWAALLNGCATLKNLAIHADPTALWSEDVGLEMPVAPPEDAPRLRTLRISGDCKVLGPLGAWLLPSGFLVALHTLAIDVDYVLDDYDPPDRRLPLVLAGAASLEVLTLHLDPPMPLSTPADVPISLASFPLLHTLHLKDGPDAEFGASLRWLADFLHAPATDHITPADSALESVSLAHSLVRRDIDAVPASTWRALEAALLASPRLHALTFKGYGKYSVGSAPGAFAHFAGTVRAQLAGLEARGVLRTVQ
ncbi:hypothetical protein B0H17DRAFT_651744 [Mycena rosella]|uniref:F-box domain-containing protein n=1 Tax=Mycena rosella TaxID=1033263 RepID=A0AAD7BCC0_MYCRO|nr:hypothetical protein B0H17DRAFT_651744 [Mycena rosella]